MRKKDTLKYYLNLWRLWLAYVAFSVSKEKEKIYMDIEMWNSIKKLSGTNWRCLAYYMLVYKEFRNIFLYRIRTTIFVAIVKVLFPPMETLYLACPEIGGGLFIQHGFSTIVAAERIGINCWINQQVTIGYKQNEAPKIGNNVNISCGAIVLGGVTVHDGAIVGAGAVVVHDVPTNTVVGGVPAKIIKVKNYE